MIIGYLRCVHRIGSSVHRIGSSFTADDPPTTSPFPDDVVGSDQNGFPMPQPCSGGVVQPGDKTAAEKSLVDNERKINEAIANRDRPAFLALAAADGAWATGGSFVPIGMLAGAFDRLNVTSWDVVNPHVLWVDQTTAIVAYGWTGAGTFLDQPLAPRRIASTVWTRRSDKWVAVFHQESDAMMP